MALCIGFGCRLLGFRAWALCLDVAVRRHWALVLLEGLWFTFVIQG